MHRRVQWVRAADATTFVTHPEDVAVLVVVLFELSKVNVAPSWVFTLTWPKSGFRLPVWEVRVIPSCHVCDIRDVANRSFVVHGFHHCTQCAGG